MHLQFQDCARTVRGNKNGSQNRILISYLKEIKFCLSAMEFHRSTLLVYQKGVFDDATETHNTFPESIISSKWNAYKTVAEDGLLSRSRYENTEKHKSLLLHNFPSSVFSWCSPNPMGKSYQPWWKWMCGIVIHEVILRDQSTNDPW